MSATQPTESALVATIDGRDYSSVSFAMEPIVNGCLFHGHKDRVSLSDLEKDGWAEHIAVTDEPDSPELRLELAGILERRFESTREAQERQKRIGDKREKAGLPRRVLPIGAPAPPVTLKMLQKARYDSTEARDMNIAYFKEHGVPPEDFDEEGKPLPPTTIEGDGADFCAIGELEDGGTKMLVDGFMPEGITMLGALPGECKTFFALSLSKALTTGKPFLGRFKISETVPVLYLIPESSGAPFRKRCEMFGIPNDRRKFLCRTISQGSPFAVDDPKVMAAVRRMKPLVVLDTAVRFNKSTDENSASANKFFVNDAIALIGAGARGVLGLHHATKSSRKEGLTPESALRGTGDLSAMADCVYGLQRNDKLFDNGNGPLELQVICLKPRDFDPPLPFTIAAKAKVGDRLISHLDTKGDFVIVEVSTLTQDLNKRFVEIVTANPRWSYADVAEEMGIQRRKVQHIAEKLHFVKRNGMWTSSHFATGVSEDPKASQDVQEEKD